MFETDIDINIYDMLWLFVWVSGGVGLTSVAKTNAHTHEFWFGVGIFYAIGMVILLRVIQEKFGDDNE